jgi:hypothetical protein
VLTAKPDKPSLADGLNGAWLISVAAFQSVVILADVRVVLFEVGKEISVTGCRKGRGRHSKRAGSK